MATQADVAQALQASGVSVFGLNVRAAGETTEVRGTVSSEAERRKAEQALASKVGAGRYVNLIEVQVPTGTSGGTTGASAGEQSYIVKAGDSLGRIAQQHYGDASQWKRIWDANRDHIPDPDQIHPGQRLTIPTGD